MRYLSANQFEVYEEIGKGGFGTVYRGLDRVTKEQVAIKLIDLEDKNCIDDFQKEIKILSECRLDQITRYYGCFVKGHKLWIIMEYLDGGSCYDLLAPGPIKEKYIAILLRELLIALAYLHGHSRIHRDVKSGNILMNTKGEVKIADFGVATQLSSNLSKRDTFVGSPYWMPPEIIQEEEYSFKADIWSLGITAIELATGKPPLSHIPPMKALFMIPKNDSPRLESDTFSAEFKEFVNLCLQKNPAKRPSAKRLLETKFISKAGYTSKLVDLIKRRRLWEFHKEQNSNSRSEKRYYVPTIKESVKDKENRITFDFDFPEAENVSEVVISKKSPLKYNNNELQYLKENRDISNIPDPENSRGDALLKRNYSSNLSSLDLKRHQKKSTSPEKAELNRLFRKTLDQLQVNKSEQAKLEEVNKSLQTLDDSTLVDFFSSFMNNYQSSVYLRKTDNKKQMGPKRAESEKLLLKRWTDQYFS